MNRTAIAHETSDDDSSIAQGLTTSRQMHFPPQSPTQINGGQMVTLEAPIKSIPTNSRSLQNVNLSDINRTFILAGSTKRY